MQKLNYLPKAIAREIVGLISPSTLHRRNIRYAAAREKEVAVLPALCKRDKIAIDVGANIGLYVYHLLPIVEEVIVFEPNPVMQATLKRFYGKSIRLEGVALSNQQGRAELRMPKGNADWATIANTNKLDLADASRGFETVSVDVRTLDSYCFEKVGLIKIDVEGHEEAVLNGALNTIQRDSPNLIVEVEERHNPGSVERVAEMLSRYQYDGYFIWDGTIHSIDNFDPSRDQSITNIGEVGKIGRYINNFIYVPRGDAINTLNYINRAIELAPLV
jgi:FkbM family methyltransferase